MRPLYRILFFLSFGFSSFAQTTRVEVNASGVGGYGTVRIDDPGELGPKPVVNVNYDEIGGTAFLDEKWNAAILVTASYNIIIPEVKLNFYTGEIWYKNATEEILSVPAGVVTRAIFFKGDDTTKELARYIYLPFIQQTNRYLQALNEGTTQLLKQHNVILYKRPYDAGAGKQYYSFVDHPEYYLVFNDKVTKLVNLNKEVIFSIMHPSEDEITWLKENNNKLRNEKDFVLFFNYYDRQHQPVSKP